MGKSFSIESLYAALLIQETFFNDSNRNLRYEPEFELNMISSTLETQSPDILNIMLASDIVIKCYLQNENPYNSYKIKCMVKYLLGMIIGWQSNYEHFLTTILDSIKVYDPNLVFIVVDWTFATQFYSKENERIY